MTRRLLIVLAGALLAGLAGAAVARDSVSFSLSIGTPAYIHAPSHVYYAPPPVHYVPAPVYYAPPVVHIPAPAVIHIAPKHRHFVRDHERRHWHKNRKWDRGWRR
jgi:hypothetical protein